MPSIKFNLLTKEIEMKGSESFIESNFNKIQDLLVENFGVKKMIAPRRTKTTQEPVSAVKMKESQAGIEINRHERSESPILPVTKSGIPEFSHEMNDPAASCGEYEPERSKSKRPPLRKYIRKEGMPGHQRIVVEVVEQKPKEISIASLKEKFGLSESKIGGIIRDAEKLGKIRRVMNGSYSWT
jgi:hypothetical protein